MGKVERICERLENNWSRSSVHRRMWKYIGVYTIVFTVTFVLVYSAFIFGGKSFIWSGGGGDGRTVFYPDTIYVGRYVRRAVLSIFHGNGLPLYDISMAMGSDIIGTLYNQGAFSLFGLLAAFVPTHYIEAYFDFLVFFRLYLMGLTFSLMCFHFGKRKLYTLIGALIYLFSGISVIAAAAHSSFWLYAYIEFPLIIMGADMILQKKKPYVLMAAVFFSALGGFYVLYMMSIVMGLFILIQGYEIYPRGKLKERFGAYFRCIAFYFLGLSLAAVLFVPSVMVFFEGGRAGFTNAGNLLHYDLDWYVEKIGNLIAPGFTMYLDSNGGMSVAAIVLPAAALICFSSNRDDRALRRILFLLFAILLIPFGGYVMNGFQYPSLRWIFILDLFWAYTVVTMMPVMAKMQRKEKWICLLVTLLYTLFTVCIPALRTETHLFGIVILTITVLSLFVGQELCGKCLWQKYGAGLLILAVVIVNAGIFGFYTFSPTEGNIISEFPNYGARTNIIENTPELSILQFLSDDPGRVDGTQNTVKQNHNMVWQVPTINGYFSVMNGNTMELFNELEISEKTMLFRIKGSDQRAIFTTLLSAKYFMDAERWLLYAPFGYVPFQTVGNYWTLENEYALPWGYTYDHSVSYSDLDGKSGVEKEEIMLQAVALEDRGDGKPDSWEGVQLDEYTLPFEMKFNGCEWKDNELVVSKKNATITLENYSMPASTEEYVRLSGFVLDVNGPTGIFVDVSDGEVNKGFTAYSSKRPHYYGCENYLVNLGYSEEERTSCTITFPSVGSFQLDDIQLIALPMDNYPERVEALRAEPLENIQWGTNSLTGTVDLSKDKILCVSVPYSKGWSATVDGEEAEILRGNYMFMCLPLTAGHHDIEFHYCSPGIKLGAVLTVCSAGIVIWMLVRDRKRRKSA